MASRLSRVFFHGVNYVRISPVITSYSKPIIFIWSAFAVIFLAYLFSSKFKLPFAFRAPKIKRLVSGEHGETPSFRSSSVPHPVFSKPRQQFEYFLVLDVEATCIAGSGLNWPNEIIEWPVVILTWADRDEEGRASQLEMVDEFRSYVRPTWKPKLSEFCVTLTGITQAQVDSAPTFPEVLDNFRAFLCRHGLISRQTGKRLRNFTWATDGPFDIRDFVVKQCFISKVKLPGWLNGDVLDVRKEVASWIIRNADPSEKSPYNLSFTKSLNISRQLEALFLAPFQGRQHSGIDDTRNIARIVMELGRRGVHLRPNLKIHPGRRWYWMGARPGEILEDYFH